MSLKQLIQEARITHARFLLESTMSDLRDNPKVKDPEALGGWLYWHKTKKPKGGVQTKAGRDKLSKKAKERSAKEKETTKKDPHAHEKGVLAKHGATPATPKRIEDFIQRQIAKGATHIQVHPATQTLEDGWQSGDPSTNYAGTRKNYDSTEAMAKALRKVMIPERIADIGESGFTTVVGPGKIQSIGFHTKKEETERKFRGRGQTMTAKDMDAFKADLLKQGARHMQRREADRTPFTWQKGDPMGNVRQTKTFKTPEELQKRLESLKPEDVVDHGKGVLTFIDSDGKFESYTFDSPPEKTKKPKNAFKTRSATETALKQAGLTQVAGGAKFAYYAPKGSGKTGKMLRVSKTTVRPVERGHKEEYGKKKLVDNPIAGETYFGSLNPEELAELMKFIS